MILRLVEIISGQMLGIDALMGLSDLARIGSVRQSGPLH